MTLSAVATAVSYSVPCSALGSFVRHWPESSSTSRAGQLMSSVTKDDFSIRYYLKPHLAGAISPSRFANTDFGGSTHL